MMIRKFAIGIAFACLVLSPALASAADTSTASQATKSLSDKPMAPEFGPSVVFDSTDTPVQLSDLRGKMAVVVFFQSWCPICNGWSPEMLSQMTKSFGDDPAVALVAIKVDGGSPADAKKYLTSKGADLSKWIVASDTGGLYYQRVSGTNALWGYALIDDEGHLVERGKAGTYYAGGAAKRFVLADPKLKEKAPKAAPIFPADELTTPELKRIAKAAEMGHVGTALRALKSFEKGDTKEAAAKMHATLLDNLAARVEKASADLKSDDLTARYTGFHILKSMSVLTDTAAGKSAKATLASLKTDKALLKDLNNDERAESAFWAMISRAQAVEIEQRKEKLPDALKQFAASYTGTSYADRALNEAQTIATGTLAR